LTRVLVVGLDGFGAGLAEAYLSDLPNIRALTERGGYGPLESIVQPVTPPAWTSILSGRNPGHFGFTDFTCRSGRGYTEFKLVHSRLVRVPTLYTLLPEAGRRAIMIGVPITYPPVTIRDGVCVSCFMAPSLDRDITQPPELKAELLGKTSSPYLLDVAVEESDSPLDRDALVARLREFDRQRFDLAAHLMTTRPWDLLFLVCQGTDRAAHYFMRYEDPAHGRYDPDPRYRHTIRDHYRYCDQRLGELAALAGPDTVIMVVSDHGVQRLDGKVNLNDVLVGGGFLRLGSLPSQPTPLVRADVDWPHTQAWARGYGGQIYLNVKGREPTGCIEPAEAPAVIEGIGKCLAGLKRPSGEPLEVNLVRRDDIYSGPLADTCPDLFVQFDELRYLTSDTVGHSKPVTPVRELGLDDASHATAGFWAMAGPGLPALGRFGAAHVYDVAPTILTLLGLPLPEGLDGRPLLGDDDVYSEEDKDLLTSRLRTLYLE